MTAQIRELSRVEFAQQVRDGIEAYDNSGGPYLEKMHCHLARKLGYTEQEIKEGVLQPWLDALERSRKRKEGTANASADEGCDRSAAV
jgi:hypothetical protein